MIGRRMVAAGVVVAAVTTGAVTGALVGIPGLSSASSSPSSVSTAATSNGTPPAGHHVRGFRGPGFGAGKGVLDAAATALKLSTADLLKKLSDGKTTIADVAQQQNVTLKTVTDAMEAVTNTEISDLVNHPFPAFPKFNGNAPKGGKGPMGGGAGFGFGFGGELRGSIDSLATTLGISPQDLLKDLGSGKSIAGIARSKHLDVKSIIKTLVDDATAKINAAVKDGHLKQDQATKIEANLKDMITKLVNNSGFGGAKSGHRGFGHFGFGGPGFGGPGGLGSGGSAPMPPSPPAPSA